ncbi:enolase C-terminal domain-like protein [Telmatospirillum sp. J64-1]|uniref:enolase C-terminal domain-like protein n=1 Tax=Telmatospirillum sp. J64-1 TaxID=2502183 RepID=UPI00115D8FA0|nr:enolase C-terminal domain-like protein [Telmatospirillum sp. J64-1]
MTDISFKIVRIELFERPVRLRIPFRFGVATVTETAQAFARVEIALKDGRRASGMSAELMVPKWFDKDPGLTSADTIEQLRFVLGRAAAAYEDGESRTAFGHFLAHHHEVKRVCGQAGIPPLAAAFGPALLDKAILDALGRLLNLSFDRMVRGNVIGLDVGTPLTPDLRGFDLRRFLDGLQPVPAIAARHTVGLIDPILTAEIPPDQQVTDGLPHSLEQVVAAYGQRHFKVKVGGNRAEDLERLKRIAAVLDTLSAPYLVTLDGNEQYAEAAEILALWRDMGETPALRRFVASVAFIEQPIARARSFETPIHDLAQAIPVIIDEADGEMESFPAALALGYSGISSKACKGLYKSLINAARCAHWNAAQSPPRFFQSAEDLTTQAGLGVQQDLALVGLLGLRHVERNGHHYVDGFGSAPEAEAEAFLKAHPALYRRHGNGPIRLDIRDGMLDLTSLWQPGFAALCHPVTASLQPLAAPREAPRPAAEVR